MPGENYGAQQAHIEKEIAFLQKKAESLKTKRRKPVITSIVNSMRQYEITTDKLVAAMDASVAKKPRKTASPDAAKRPVAAKFRHPDTGESWSGRGKAPRWLVAAEASGTPRTSFAVD